MFRLISVILIVLVIGWPKHSTGYTWISERYYNRIKRQYAIKLTDRTYVGRAYHYNLVLPAEVHNHTHAVFIHDDQEIVTTEFELLMSMKPCEWELVSNISKLSPDVVLAGSAWNKEPIYMAKTTNKDDNQTHIASILIESNRVITWGRYRNIFSLNCGGNSSWVETSEAKLPKNAVSEAFDPYDREYFIGRLLGPSSWVLARISRRSKTALAEYDNVQIESPYSQVLIDNSRHCRWDESKFGRIPDHSVVLGQADTGEMRYIVRFDRNSTYHLASELRRYSNYSILICGDPHNYYDF